MSSSVIHSKYWWARNSTLQLPAICRAWAAALKVGPDIYQSIGVEPIVNAKGTFTIITGSQSLPEVKAAMEAASRHYVHLDELMPAVGRRLSELTKAEWGMVSNGCAAALAHATAACVAGADPEKLQRLPDLRWGGRTHHRGGVHQRVGRSRGRWARGP